MLIAVEVVGRALQLRGSTHQIGDRIMLDPADPQHQEVLDKDWARRLDAPSRTEPATTATIAEPPQQTMVSGATTKAAQPVAPARKPHSQQRGKEQ